MYPTPDSSDPVPSLVSSESSESSESRAAGTSAGTPTSPPSEGRGRSPRLAQGAFQIYTGEGKGKSTASMGLMLRALGCGFAVYYLRMMKPRWKTGELAICPTLHPRLTYRNVEQDWILSRSKHIPEHVRAMSEALSREMDQLEQEMCSGAHDIVIVDEINYCIHRGLISLERALQLVAKRPVTVELVFTGRHAPDALVEAADIVTEMRKIKHHFDRGVAARRGIEF